MITFAKVEHPFPGLRPFKEEEYNLFFGREGQSDELLARLGRKRFLAVVGTSGSGKSSLIRAGLLPALRGGLMAGANPSWRIALLRPGHDPFGELARALCDGGVLGSRAKDPEVAAALVETTLRRSSLGLVEASQARLAGHESLLVVVDQFEELFRFKRVARGGDDDAAAFVKLLLEAAAQRDVPVYVVITMRSDFLGDCTQFRGLPEVINDAQYLIPRMTLDERSEAITGPVAVGGAQITSRLVSRLLNDMGDSPDQLPILQHALMRTWDFWAARGRNGAPLDLPHYAAAGTMERALSAHADEAFEELPKEGPARRTAELMFKALTEKGADNRETRRPTRLRELCAVTGATEEEVVSVIEVFRREGRSFLMPPEGVALAPDTVIDISHESLIRNWERLRQWVNEEALSARTYRRLAEAALLHREGHEGLLTDPRLQLDLDWRDRHRPTAAWAARYHDQFDLAAVFPDEPDADARHACLFSLAMSFLDRSRDERDAEAERMRAQEQLELQRTKAFAEQQARAASRLRWLAATLAVFVALALALAAYAYRQKAQAEANQQTADAALKRATDAEKSLTLTNASLAASYDEEKKARADADEQRLLAERNAQAAEEAKGAALEAQQRAEAEAARANRAAADERRARLSLKSALDRADALMERGRYFRVTLNNWDRAMTNDERYAVAEKLLEGVEGFKRVEDYDSAAAAYFSLGNLKGSADKSDAQTRKATPSKLAPWESRRDTYWPEAVKFYRLSGNHAEAGQTLISIGDTAVFSDNQQTVSEQAIARAVGRYREAIEEFRKANPPDPAGHVTVLSRLARFTNDPRRANNREELIKIYEESLEVQKRHPQFSLLEVASNLIGLYYQQEPPARAEALAEKAIEGVRATAGELEAHLLSRLVSDVTFQNQLPLEIRLKYFERALEIYRRAPNTELFRSQLLLAVAYSLKDEEEAKAVRREATSPERYRQALGYFEEALKSIEPMAKTDGAWAYVLRTALQSMGEIHEATGRRREATDAYQRALALFEVEMGIEIKPQDVPKIISQFRYVIKFLADDGDLPRAREVCRRLVNLYQMFPPGSGQEEAERMCNSLTEKGRERQTPAPPR